MLSQFERVDRRCSQLETSQIEFIQAREQLLSEQNERDIEAAQAAQSLQLKERAIEGLFTNMPALLELWKMHTESQKETKEEAAKVSVLPEKVEQGVESVSPSEAVVVIEEKAHADS
jgi:ribosomal protein S2